MENMSLTEIRNQIYLFSLIDILKKKKLTFDFVCKYILNPDFQITKEEEEITIDMVCQYQPHLEKILKENSYIAKQVVVDWPNFQEIAEQ